MNEDRLVWVFVLSGVKEATEAFKLWKAAKMNKEQLEQERNDRKPAPYKFVKVNEQTRYSLFFLMFK